MNRIILISVAFLIVWGFGYWLLKEAKKESAKLKDKKHKKGLPEFRIRNF